MNYLVMHDGIPDGQIFDAHLMRRELIRARFHGWYCTIIEVSDDFKNELNDVLAELE
jgi:hypothetical protein